jgi:hypothetical protein
MAKDQPEFPNLFNPFALWADLGMRAAEMAVASTQNLTEGADRVTRAAAGTEADEIVDTSSSPYSTAGGWPAPGLGGFADMQRLAWDLMAQNWLRWVSTAGNLMSASAGEGLARKGVSSMVAGEHAWAPHEPKPRRKAAAKTRHTRGVSRSR